MDYRIERDSMGEVRVPKNARYGAQTQRSLENFPIGKEKMPREVLVALIQVKKACALVNGQLGQLDEDIADSIVSACQDLLSKPLSRGDFPLAVWQTGSGTQTNMNVNEVIAHIANEKRSDNFIHPNDHVNRGQSSNDVFPTAMHIAAVGAIENKLLPVLEKMIYILRSQEKKYHDVITVGRTHMMDATPIRYSQMLSGYRVGLEACQDMIQETLRHLRQLPIGGTAVGTGLNVPEGFVTAVVRELTRATGLTFVGDNNKFYGLSQKNAFVFMHQALKALATHLLKMVNDLRMMASGPRAGLAEIEIPANEPGSSIMPGKVNPTQIEALSMVCVQVIANDLAISYANSLGNFQLNTYMPLIIHDFLQSVNILSDGMESFCDRCLSGMKPKTEKMRENVDHSLMLVTKLNPVIGYEKGAKVVNKALAENISLKEATLELGYLTEEEFDAQMDPWDMV